MTSCDLCASYAAGADAEHPLLHATEHWTIRGLDHNFGAGCMLIVPNRHVTRIPDLIPTEVAELGQLIWATSSAGFELGDDVEQTYVCLWSHREKPRHVHFVVHPVGDATVRQFGLRGPALHSEMLVRGERADPGEMAEFVSRARAWFSSSPQLAQ